MQTYCVYCETPFIENQGSKEHVILNSFGGKKITRNVCCNSCNVRLGIEVDKVTSEEYSFFLTMLGTVSGTGRPAPTQKAAFMFAGRPFNISPSGKVSGPGRIDVTSVSPTEEMVQVQASSVEEAQVLLASFLQGKGKTIDDLKDRIVRETSAPIPTLNRGMEIGGFEQCRSFTKMMINYAASCMSPPRLRGGAFNRAFAFINGSDQDFDGAVLDGITAFPESPRISSINHRVFFFSSFEKGTALGLLELFGSFRFSAVLSDTWDGPDISCGYAIDPKTSQWEEKFVEPPDQLHDTVEQHQWHPEIAKNMLTPLLQKIAEDQTGEYISTTVASCFAEVGVDLSGNIPITEEQIRQFSSLVAYKLAHQICRLPYEREIEVPKGFLDSIN